jgi:RNA polymerase sigma factor (sigma-70 family)
MTPRHLLEPGRLAGSALLKAQSDSRLVDMTRAGNDRAFEAIVDRYKAPLLRYCSRILPDGRGEDAVQQTFLKAYNALHSDTTPLSLRSWLFGIAHNVSLNTLRQRGSDHEPLEAHEGTDEAVHATLERRERFREVLAAVAALPPGQRDALLLRELEGRGHDEIARELGVTGGAARQLISRARSGIREAAAAILPLPFVMRLTDGTAAPPTAERLAELTAVGAGVTVTKVVATAAVGGTLLGGAAVTGPDLVQGEKERRSADTAQAAPSSTEAQRDAEAAARSDGGRDDDRSGPGGGDDDDRDDDDREGDDDRSGPGGGDEDDTEDNSGPGSGGGDEPDDGDNSGPGSGGDADDDPADTDNSGPGSGGDADDDPADTDNSGPGSGGDDPVEADSDNSGPGGGGDPDPVDVIEPDDGVEPETDDSDNSGPGNAKD